MPFEVAASTTWSAGESPSRVGTTALTASPLNASAPGRDASSPGAVQVRPPSFVRMMPMLALSKSILVFELFPVPANAVRPDGSSGLRAIDRIDSEGRRSVVVVQDGWAASKLSVTQRPP